jgi:hypothetical protein
MNAASRALAQEHSFEQQAEEFMALYHEITNAKQMTNDEIR